MTCVVGLDIRNHAVNLEQIREDDACAFSADPRARVCLSLLVLLIFGWLPHHCPFPELNRVLKHSRSHRGTR